MQEHIILDLNIYNEFGEIIFVNLWFFPSCRLNQTICAPLLLLIFVQVKHFYSNCSWNLQKNKFYFHPNNGLIPQTLGISLPVFLTKYACHERACVWELLFRSFCGVGKCTDFDSNPWVHVLTKYVCRERTCDWELLFRSFCGVACNVKNYWPLHFSM